MSWMQHVTFHLGKYRIALGMHALQEMMRFRQHRPRSREACGVLLGYEWEQAFEIVVATPPQESDSRQCCSYIRDVAGHLAIATALWRDSAETIGYLGEWHTHPQRIPRPSHRDLSEANRIAQKNGAAVVSLILGTTHGCAFMAFGDEISDMKHFALPRRSSKTMASDPSFIGHWLKRLISRLN